LRPTLADRIASYLSQRIDYEPNPYYKGRYFVARQILVYLHTSKPYEVAEAVFRQTHFSRKIERWFEVRREQFPCLHINFDGSLGDWKDRAEVIELPKVRKAAA